MVLALATVGRVTVSRAEGNVGLVTELRNGANADLVMVKAVPANADLAMAVPANGGLAMAVTSGLLRIHWSRLWMPIRTERFLPRKSRMRLLP